MIAIEVDDRAVREALAKLRGRSSNLTPVMQALGEDIMERTKQRFATATGPDGTRWRANAQSTLTAYIESRGGFGKRGINAKGRALAANKRPLQGHTGDLARQFHVNADANSVTITNSVLWAAIHQFGGKAGSGHKVSIPARPFLPITSSGDLYPQERDLIVAELQRYISGA